MGLSHRRQFRGRPWVLCGPFRGQFGPRSFPHDVDCPQTPPPAPVRDPGTRRSGRSRVELEADGGLRRTRRSNTRLSPTGGPARGGGSRTRRRPCVRQRNTTASGAWSASRLSPPLPALGPWAGGGGQGCIRRRGASEATPAAVRQAVATAVGGGYCRLQTPLRLALGVRETVAGHRLGALEGWYLHPPSTAFLGGGGGQRGECNAMLGTAAASVAPPQFHDHLLPNASTTFVQSFAGVLPLSNTKPLQVLYSAPVHSPYTTSYTTLTHRTLCTTGVPAVRHPRPYRTGAHSTARPEPAKGGQEAAGARPDPPAPPVPCSESRAPLQHKCGHGPPCRRTVAHTGRAVPLSQPPIPWLAPCNVRAAFF